jgi:hypothetical protein
MIDISLINVFYPKIIKDECERDQTCFVVPKARGIDALVIPKSGQFLLETFVGKDPCLH